MATVATTIIAFWLIGSMSAAVSGYAFLTGQSLERGVDLIGRSPPERHCTYFNGLYYFSLVHVGHAASRKSCDRFVRR